MQFSPDFFDVEFSAVVVVVAQVPLAQLDGELSWKKPEINVVSFISTQFGNVLISFYRLNNDNWTKKYSIN
jgi:hypothetical protein